MARLNTIHKQTKRTMFLNVKGALFVSVTAIMLLLMACQQTPTAVPDTPTPEPTETATDTPTPTNTPTPTATPTMTPTPAAENVVKANKAIEDGAYDDAIELLTGEIDNSPGAGYLHFVRGNAYQAQGDHRKALSDYNRAIRFDHDSPSLIANRALTYLELERYDRAITEYDKVLNGLEDEQIDTFAQLNRARAYLGLEQYEDAIADLDIVIDTDPDNKFAYASRASAHINLEQYDEAIVDYNSAIEIDDRSPFYFINRAQAYSAIGDSVAAVTDFTSAIDLNPEDAFAIYNRGNLYREMGDTIAATADFESVIALDNNEVAVKFAQQQLDVINGVVPAPEPTIGPTDELDAEEPPSSEQPDGE